MELGERAEKTRNGQVDSSEDNFLKLTLEARLLSTDPRAIDPGFYRMTPTQSSMSAHGKRLKFTMKRLKTG